ncbi:MAG: xanthine dehydrogenase family protein subunit M, partial [Desulfobacterales bacterium]|nr:xanthine dehydrogenase family protein subunit M [Desulfobacterales bacterium]
LDSISYPEKQDVRLGALVTHQSIVDHPALRRDFGGLWAACSKIGTPQIRNMGTLGGNLCNGAPSADSAPPLIASRAALKLLDLNGERTIPLEDFFVGPGRTALRPGEILVEIDVPRPPLRSALVYLKLPARSAVDIAAVGVAVFLAIDAKNETCEDVRIVLGAVAPTPIRARTGEKMLRGQKITDPVIQKAAQMASADARPISDVRGSAAYRSEMVSVLTRQAVTQALAQAKTG